MKRQYQLLMLTLLATGLLIAPICARAGTFGTDMQLQLCNSGDTLANSCSSNVTGPFDDGGSGTLSVGPVAVGVWNVNLSSATGADGGLFLPTLLDLSSIDATSTGGGTGTSALKLQLTLLGLTEPLVNLQGLNTFTGSNQSNGSVTITSQAWISTSNAAFCAANCSSLTSLLSFTTNGPGTQPFSGSKSGTAATGGGPYSLTLVITISSALADHTSLDSRLDMVPEPATLSVMGAGLLALGTGLRRKLVKRA